MNSYYAILTKCKYALLLVMLIVYLASLTQHWIPADDSALYLANAKSYHQTGMFMVNGEPKLVASPGFPVLLSYIMSIGGADNFFLMQVLMLCFGLSGMFILYRQRWIWRTRLQADIVFYATVTGYYFFHNIRRIMTEAPSFLLFCILIALLRGANTRKWLLVFACAVCYAAVMIRIPFIAVLVAMGIALLFEKHLVSEKLKWRFLGSGVLAIGSILGWFHAERIASSYESPATYSVATVSGFENTLFSIVNDIGKLFSDMALMQGNCAVGWGFIVIIVIAALRCFRKNDRRLAFPIVFIVAYAVLVIAFVGSWTMMPRYWIFGLPFIIYYLFIGFELLSAWLTKLCGLKKPAIRLPVFAAMIIGAMLLVQTIHFIRDDMASIAGWKSSERFYAKYNNGRHAVIMSIARQLKEDESCEWIAASDNVSSLILASGKKVHSLVRKPLKVMDSECWKEHPPSKLLVKKPRDSYERKKKVFVQIMAELKNNKEWSESERVKEWYIFERTSKAEK